MSDILKHNIDMILRNNGMYGGIVEEVTEEIMEAIANDIRSYQI